MSKKVFIGYDSSQKDAYDVLEYSILKHNKAGDVEIHPLNLVEIEKLGFRRAHDPLQATEFTYTRFLVPWLCNYQGVALFLDSDMLALGDVGELFDLDMSNLAIRVVKHKHQPESGLKMGKLGRVQTDYPRKNWSSLMLMNCSELECWTKEEVEIQTGAWLHRFIPIPDEKIGEIDGSVWNVLDRYDADTKLVHYTSGGPWTGYGDVWIQERVAMDVERVRVQMEKAKIVRPGA